MEQRAKADLGLWLSVVGMYRSETLGSRGILNKI